MLVYGECECFVMQMLYVCVLCASCGSSQCCVLHDLQFVNAGRGCNRHLTPSAPSSPLFIQLTPNPLIPSALSNFSPVISPPQHISPTPHDPFTNSNPQQLSPNHVQKKPLNSICKATVCMVKKVLPVLIIPIQPCASSTLKENQRVV